MNIIINMSNVLPQHLNVRQEETLERLVAFAERVAQQREGARRHLFDRVQQHQRAVLVVDHVDRTPAVLCDAYAHDYRTMRKRILVR